MLEKFETYQMSLALIKGCEKLKLKPYMKSQLERAALSVALNLSEGNVRTTLKDKRRFFMMAYGSVREVQTLLQLISAQEQFKLADQIGACLYTMCKNLNR